MNLGTFNLKNSILLIGLASFLIISCDDSKKEIVSDELSDKDTIKSVGLNFDGELFSFPSPVQTALLIQKSGAHYDKLMLNPGNKHTLYKTDFSKSLNLGVYGADLGYVSIHNQTQDALIYLAAVKSLSDNLGISKAFDNEMITRIKDNISIKDSMLVLVGLAYRQSDSYLKANKRKEISSLILTGGWLESMHFLLKAHGKKSNQDIKNRIAEQKRILKSLIKLLKSHNLPEASNLISDLERLFAVFDTVIYKYTFIEPTTDEFNKTTTINSFTDITITENQINEMTEIVSRIRKSIINSKS